MRITICELPAQRLPFESAWERLCAHAHAASSDLVVLPEMPFADWPCAAPEPDVDVWAASVAEHENWLARLPELGAVAIATRPIQQGDRRLNRGFASAAGVVQELHDKYYLPDEEGYWEASWYSRGDGSFEVAEVAGARVGMQICTELWFFDRARTYGQDGAQILVVPRATPRSTTRRWIAAGATAAVVAGAWCASSNLVEPAGASAADLGGGGWLFDPEGNVVARTSEATPFVTTDLDLAVADAARLGYPRYVAD